MSTGKRIRVKTERDVFDWISSKAHKHDRSFSWVVNTFLRLVIEREGNKKGEISSGK